MSPIASRRFSARSQSIELFVAFQRHWLTEFFLRLFIFERPFHFFILQLQSNSSLPLLIENTSYRSETKRARRPSTCRAKDKHFPMKPRDDGESSEERRTTCLSLLLFFSIADVNDSILIRSTDSFDGCARGQSSPIRCFKGGKFGRVDRKKEGTGNRFKSLSLSILLYSRKQCFQASRTSRRSRSMCAQSL